MIAAKPQFVSFHKLTSRVQAVLSADNSRDGQRPTPDTTAAPYTAQRESAPKLTPAPNIRVTRTGTFCFHNQDYIT
jgi:hypothetical protein